LMFKIESRINELVTEYYKTKENGS
jgi:hypothetical protein